MCDLACLQDVIQDLGPASVCMCSIVSDSLRPMDCSPPGSYVHEILQARILERVAMPFSKGSSQPRDQTCVSYIPCIGRCILYH